MKFLKLFSISLLHDYYRSGICTDIQMQPTSATLLKFQNYRLVYKQSPSACVVLARFDHKNEPFIQIPTDEVFEFELVLKNPLFDNITAGLYSELLKLERVQQPSKLWGRLKLSYKKLFQNGVLKPEQNLQLKFTAVETVWEYYLLADNDVAAEDVAIRQNDFSDNTLKFLSATTIEKNTDNRTAKKIIDQFPDQKLFLITSQEKIKLQEKAHKHIELKVNNKTVQRNLPNPGTDNQPLIIKCINN